MAGGEGVVKKMKLEFHFLIGPNQPLGDSKTPLRSKKDHLSFPQFTKKKVLMSVPVLKQILLKREDKVM